MDRVTEITERLTRDFVAGRGAVEVLARMPRTPAEAMERLNMFWGRALNSERELADLRVMAENASGEMLSFRRDLQRYLRGPGRMLEPEVAAIVQEAIEIAEDVAKKVWDAYMPITNARKMVREIQGLV